MPRIISAESKQKAIRLYKNKDLTIEEIGNITDISKYYLFKLYRECFKNGTLKPRDEQKALIQPNEKKFTDEQEQEIAIDYYINDLSVPQLRQKWNIHPMQLQRIRNKFKDQYPQKDCVPKKFKKEQKV